MNSENNNRPTDLMANERTFLAWIRTSMGFIAFGFVMERFSLFLKEMIFLMPNDQTLKETTSSASLQSFSEMVGISMILFGGLLACLAFFRYRQDKKRIEEGRYRSSAFLGTILTLAIVITTLFLLINLT